MRVLGGQLLLLLGLLSNLKEDVPLQVLCAEYEHSDALAVGRHILEELLGPSLALKQVQYFTRHGCAVVVHCSDLFGGREWCHQVSLQLPSDVNVDDEKTPFAYFSNHVRSLLINCGGVDEGQPPDHI